MNWWFFESLSKTEAQEFLDNFLTVESVEIQTLIKSAQKQGIATDFSVDSIEPLFHFSLDQIETVSKEPDGRLPDYILGSSSYIENLFDFSEASKVIIVKLAYYLGEAFVRTYPQLSWSTGNQENAEQNMPVITGFNHNLEMAPMLISENIIARVIADPESSGDIKAMVKSWQEDIKS